MKKVQKIIAIFLILALCLPFVFACGESEKDDNAPTTAAVDENNNADAVDNAAAPADETPAENVPAVEEATPAPVVEEAPVEDVPDSGTVKLLGKDSESQGDWIGKYGSEGYMIAEEFDELTKLPDYAKIEFEDEQFWTWWDSADGEPAHDDEELAAEREPNALYKSADKTERIAACWYKGDYFSLTVSVGNAPKKVTLYMNDFDSHDRSAEVVTRNKTGKAMKEPAEKVFFDVGEYSVGCYVSYVITGEIMFEFESISGANVVLSGVFFDPAP